MREFDTGATRDTDDGKLDFEGFLSPKVLERYAEYMHENRIQADGQLRDSDNWQKGIPQEAYVKSGWRHFFAFWKAWRRGDREGGVQDACALLFNIMGWLHEEIKDVKVLVVPSGCAFAEESNWNPQPGPQAEFMRQAVYPDGTVVETPVKQSYTGLPGYETEVVETEWSVHCDCGYDGTLDTLILDQINSACLCPECCTPLMGLDLQIVLPEEPEIKKPNLYEEIVKLVTLADAYGMGREKLVELVTKKMGSMG